MGAAFPPNAPGASTDFAVVRYNGGGITGLDQEDNGQIIVDIHPNPMNSSAAIQFNSLLNNAELNIFDVSGQKIKTIKNISRQTITLYRAELASGLYFIQIIQGGRIIAINKLIITD
ncbi:MAG: T9SS type A sorting domain-containing protein [Bacteroidetes bacterium]|nr:T9SS type A sorting domain-containing protein [Bacteroidota bacterium]